LQIFCSIIDPLYVLSFIGFIGSTNQIPLVIFCFKFNLVAPVQFLPFVKRPELETIISEQIDNPSLSHRTDSGWRRVYSVEEPREDGSVLLFFE